MLSGIVDFTGKTMLKTTKLQGSDNEISCLPKMRGKRETDNKGDRIARKLDKLSGEGRV